MIWSALALDLQRLKKSITKDVSNVPIIFILTLTHVGTTCGWQLTLTNYTFWDGFIYCKNHYPVTGFGDGTAKHVSGEVKTTDYGLETSMSKITFSVIVLNF